jgi:hypothetical protein
MEKMKAIADIDDVHNPVCPNCGKSFVRTRPNKKYCQVRCRGAVADMKYGRRHSPERLKMYRAQFLQDGKCVKCGRANPEKDIYKTCPDCRDAVAQRRN